MGTRISTACAAATAMLMVRVAAADDPHARANVLYRQGAAAAVRGDHGSAYVSFLESYRLWPRAATLGNIAWAEVELGHLLEGFRHLKEAGQAPDLDDKQRAIVQNNVHEVYAKLGHLAIQADEGATVTIDGTAAPGAPPLEEPLDVLPGHHELEASVGRRTSRAPAEAIAGEVVTVDLRMPFLEPLAPPGPSDVASPPPIPSPRELGAPPSGAGAGATTWWTAPRVVGVGLGAAAVIAAGLGVSFELASQAAANDASRMRAGLGAGTCASSPSKSPACTALQGKIDAVHTDESIAHTALVVGGGAAAAAAIAFWVGAQHDDGQTKSALRWTLLPNACSLWGQF